MNTTINGTLIGFSFADRCVHNTRVQMMHCIGRTCDRLGVGVTCVCSVPDRSNRFVGGWSWLSCFSSTALSVDENINKYLTAHVRTHVQFTISLIVSFVFFLSPWKEWVGEGSALSKMCNLYQKFKSCTGQKKCIPTLMYLNIHLECYLFNFFQLFLFLSFLCPLNLQCATIVL